MGGIRVGAGLCPKALPGKAKTTKKAAQQINRDRSVWRRARSLDINSPLALDGSTFAVAPTER
jgi:hypothetical protein